MLRQLLLINQFAAGKADGESGHRWVCWVLGALACLHAGSLGLVACQLVAVLVMHGGAEIRDLSGATSNGGHGGGGGLAVDSGQNRRLQGGESAITGGCNLSYTNRDLAGRH